MHYKVYQARNGFRTSYTRRFEGSLTRLDFITILMPLDLIELTLVLALKCDHSATVLRKIEPDRVGSYDASPTFQFQ